MKKLILAILVLCATTTLFAQSFPRQTDGRDSTAIPTYHTQRWGHVIMGRGSDDRWHAFRVDSSGYLLVLPAPTGNVYSDTITATTAVDTVVLSVTSDYISIAPKESYGFWIGFNDSASMYIPPGCVYSDYLAVDSVFVKMEEESSIISVIYNTY